MDWAIGKFTAISQIVELFGQPVHRSRCKQILERSQSSRGFLLPAIGRLLIAQLRGLEDDVVALTRFLEKAQTFAEQGVESAIADVFDPERRSAESSD
ncbi:hypothetical protein [Nostoc sp.]|uniref:hypothetical protein n=1 Tax=Nostoc sp. TaxID=1180 RepID=UPI002FF66DE0